jgi:carbamoyltransferase
MIVLGISDGMTGGATIVADGNVLAAVSEERFNRQKMAIGFPRQSIAEVLRIACVEIKDVDHVAVATNAMFWRPEANKLDDYFRKSKGMDRDLFLSSGSFFAKLTNGNQFSRKVYHELKALLTRRRRSKIRQRLAEEWGYQGEVSFIDHHLAHCASTYFTSGMEQATVISLDGAGDGCSSQVYSVDNGKFKLLQKLDSYDSVGNYYAYVTHLCGFQAHKHEGKITGLAAYGQPTYVDLLKRYIQYGQGSIQNIGGCFDWSAIRKLEKDLGPSFKIEDVASSIQWILEDVATQYTQHWVKQSGVSNIALAGGVVANVKLNQRIHGLPEISRTFIHPGMGDEGLATGAALFKCFQLCKTHQQPFDWNPISNVYWGPEFSNPEIERELDSLGMPYAYHEDIEKRVAGLLAKGKIVARFAGRMEYGPRALGNRSILYHPVDTSVNEWLNKRLKRTEFMPFAPVTAKDYANQCYRGLAGAELPAKFMTITTDCTEKMAEHCPAVVHIDGTARPQVVDEEDNPRYYQIVDEYRKMTGIPSLINTSFNMHEEPIVCTPHDALRAFREGSLDYLAIENFLVKGETAPS